MKKKFGWNKFRTDLAIKETDPDFIRAHEKAQKFIKEHPNVPVVDVPPVEQSDTVENVNTEWERYNHMECADKGQHDMRLAFIAGYKRALHDAAPTDDAELAELLNLLMATSVHGAILQLRDHLDGDKRLIDNYRRLYKRAESNCETPR
jgi:hypothetical protein